MMGKGSVLAALVALVVGSGVGAAATAQVSGEATATISAPEPVEPQPVEMAPATSLKPKARPVPSADTPALAATPETTTTAAPTTTTPGKAPRDPSKGAVTNLPIPRFVSLKGSEGNARRGPSLTHRIDWVFTRPGMPLRVTAEHENWRRVEDAEGMGGWVHYALLSGVRSVLVATDMAEFRTKPDARADVVFQAEQGVVGRLMECQPDWCRVNVQGEKGWIAKSALWGVEPGEVVE